MCCSIFEEVGDFGVDDDVLSDCLIMYSCVEGHYSFRCSSEGRSPFMEQMSQVVKNL